MTPIAREQQLAMNAKFLDDAIVAGHEFILSNRASEATRTFAWEIRYLLDHGYEIVGNGYRMVPKKP